MNTNRLLSLSSQYLNMNLSQISDLAQDLYQEGLVSYPRTEGSCYSPGMIDEAREILESIDHPEINDEIAEFLQNGISYVPEYCAENHPPITPVSLEHYLKKKKKAKNKTHKKILKMKNLKKYELYRLIVRYYMATLSAKCKYEDLTHIFNINSEAFKFKESVINTPGYTTHFLDHKGRLQGIKQKKTNFNSNSEFRVKSIKAQELTQCPPEFLLESDLIELMDRYGIGTDCTKPLLIKNLIGKKYIQPYRSKKDSPTRLKPTPLGMALAIGYKTIDPELIEPQVRSFIERCSKKVSEYQLKKDTVLKKVIGIFSEKFKKFKENYDTTMGQILKVFQKNPKK